MPASTRSSPRKASAPAPSDSSLKSYSKTDPKYHSLILPKTLSSAAKILTLPYPATSAPARFIFDPAPNPPRFYQLTAITSSKTDPRSFLYTSANAETSTKGTLCSSPTLLVATPFDPLFLLIPIFTSQPAPAADEDDSSPYRSLDDLLDRCSSSLPGLTYLLSHSAVESLFLSRAATICDTLSISDTTLLQLNKTKLHKVLLAKAKATLNKDGCLPPSLERQFVAEALAEPATFSSDAPASSTPNEAEKPSGLPTPPESQTTPSSTDPSPLSEIEHLQRLSTAFSLIGSLLPPSLTPSLLSLPVHTSLFLPLETHKAALTERRAKVAAAYALRRQGSSRGGIEAAEEILDRKRKREADEEAERKRKKGLSRGVKELGKVDTSGMKSMMSFFGKKAKA